jgi:superfamily II DNA or RNA helicase
MNDYYAKYLSSELTRKCPSDSIDKLAATLSEAQVDLNPHQVEAALFAFRSPFSRGAVLADEVGLGKTIEAAILLSQKWAERKRRLLVICPASLRKQWAEELEQKFFLKSIILEKGSFNAQTDLGNFNPFDQKEKVVITSLHFAKAKAAFVKGTKWDLVVIDEAHRLRNVYKPTAKIANIIKEALAQHPKVLLTATPLQNSLLELYGLVSLVDDHAFGSLESFKSQFSNLNTASSFRLLKERLKPLCQRTLRRQVLEYVRYTNRLSITEGFHPRPEEQQLYDLVSEYLQEDNLFALPKSQRALMTMIVRKLLASSSFAISGTLHGLAEKLEEQALTPAPATEIDIDAVTPGYEGGEAQSDEWVDDDGEAEDDEEGAKPVHIFTEEEKVKMRVEVARLREFQKLAESITSNSKGEALLTALSKGFDKARELGAPEKAVIFTESTRTQEYLLGLLENSQWKGKILLFNGSNSGPQAKALYQAWLAKHENTARISGSKTADTRQALVDYFREDGQIVIATEAAAEGINLQFCNLVVNYDLPWNPQRIEQRIGRCHRYGQKHDVVVVNFVNLDNAVDRRVFELLAEKFKLFEGVFGASDQVLSALESGVDFEKRIADICQHCRTPKQIDDSFDQLRTELEIPIQERLNETRQQLLENFDVEVQEKLRLNNGQAIEGRDRYSRWLWDLAGWSLKDVAEFTDTPNGKSFMLKKNPFAGEDIPEGPYRSGRNVEDTYLFRVGHPLAQRLLEQWESLQLPAAQLTFDLTGSGQNIAALQALKGQSGWLRLAKVTVQALQDEEHLVWAAITDQGQPLDVDQCRRLMGLNLLNSTQKLTTPIPSMLDDELKKQRHLLLEKVEERNRNYFETELDKLERWHEDQKQGLDYELSSLENEIRESRRQSLRVPSLAEKVAIQRQIVDLQAQLKRKRTEIFKAQDELDEKHQVLVADLQERMSREVKISELFVIQWKIV